MLKVVADEAAREDLAAGLDEIVREGARRMLAAALEDEVAAYIAAHAAERDENGRLVVRNGHARPRQVSTVAGAISTALLESGASMRKVAGTRTPAGIGVACAGFSQYFRIDRSILPANEGAAGPPCTLPAREPDLR